MNQEKVRNNIKATPELIKAINKAKHYDVEQFITDGLAYIKAIKDGRMLCIIKSVASSGMSRVLVFHSCKKMGNRYVYRGHDMLFEMLGFKMNSKRTGYVINGCGMDMVFNTNYRIIHKLERLGFIDKEECAKLAQEKPVLL